MIFIWIPKIILIKEIKHTFFKINLLNNSGWVIIPPGGELLNNPLELIPFWLWTEGIRRRRDVEVEGRAPTITISNIIF